MFGRKPTPLSATLSQRMQRIAETPASAPERGAAQTFGKRATRADAWRPGTINFQTGERMDVVVKNVSDTGALIEFVRGAYLPDRVKLTTQGTSRWAYVTWQTWGVAGLQFVRGSKAYPRGA
ncbi:MAG: hypothetical protein ACOYMK_18480 [Hyphomonadaceae bacterium]